MNFLTTEDEIQEKILVMLKMMKLKHGKQSKHSPVKSILFLKRNILENRLSYATIFGSFDLYHMITAHSDQLKK